MAGAQCWGEKVAGDEAGGGLMLSPDDKEQRKNLFLHNGKPMEKFQAPL